MKTGSPTPSRYIAKVSHASLLQRLVWWAFRRYVLNEDYYKVTRRFTGPRPRNAYSTVRADATASRYYIDPRPSALPKPMPTNYRAEWERTVGQSGVVGRANARELNIN